MLFLSVCIHCLNAAYFNRRSQEDHIPYGNIYGESMRYTANFQKDTYDH